MRKKSDTCFLFSWQIENPNSPDENGGTPSYDLPLKDNFWCSIPLAFRNCQNLSSNSWYVQHVGGTEIVKILAPL